MNKEGKMSGIIQAEDIKFSYTNNENEIRFALNGVTLEVSEGEFIVILGHNGSGKSTFAKHINALELPSSGEMWVCGKDTRREENLATHPHLPRGRQHIHFFQRLIDDFYYF